MFSSVYVGDVGLSCRPLSSTWVLVIMTTAAQSTSRCPAPTQGRTLTTKPESLSGPHAVSAFATGSGPTGAPWSGRRRSGSPARFRASSTSPGRPETCRSASTSGWCAPLTLASAASQHSLASFLLCHVTAISADLFLACMHVMGSSPAAGVMLYLICSQRDKARLLRRRLGSGCIRDGSTGSGQTRRTGALPGWLTMGRTAAPVQPSPSSPALCPCLARKASGVCLFSRISSLENLESTWPTFLAMMKAMTTSSLQTKPHCSTNSGTRRAPSCCDVRALVAEHYPWFLETYDALPKNIMRADAVRLWALIGCLLLPYGRCFLIGT